MRALALIFFFAMPLWILTTIALIASPASSGVGKADGILGIIAIGTLLMRAGLRMYQRSEAETTHTRTGGFSGH